MPTRADAPPGVRPIVGRRAEYQALRAIVDEAVQLTVVASAPCSGTSGLLATVHADTVARSVLVDARGCGDVLDLAMAVADATVRALAPEAAAWWFDRGARPSTEALRLDRTLGEDGIDLDDLRAGGGPPLERVGDALRLVRALAGGPVAVILDHLGPLLWQTGRDGTRALLGELRAHLQAQPELSLVLADYADGPAAAALADAGHPLYRAGDLVTITRPTPQRYVDELAAARLATDVRSPVLSVCAELAAGAPAQTWRAVDLADPDLPPAPAALGGWQRLRDLTEPSVAHQWDTLRRVHPLAQTVTAVVASGLRPHGTIAAHDKRITDATRTMRALGIVWQPASRGSRWAVADPLLAAYARDHAPPWVRRFQR